MYLHFNLVVLDVKSVLWDTDSMLEDLKSSFWSNFDFKVLSVNF